MEGVHPGIQYRNHDTAVSMGDGPRLLNINVSAGGAIVLNGGAGILERPLIRIEGIIGSHMRGEVKIWIGIFNGWMICEFWGEPPDI